MSEPEVMECDVVIAGAGPAGLSAAIRLMQLAEASGQSFSVIVLEKGAAVGSHILSGCVLEPRALNELLPDWRERGAPLETPATQDRFQFLTASKAYRLPTPPQMRNHGNYIISLGRFCSWLGEQAEAMGVQLFPGFPAAEVIVEDNIVRGLKTGAFGVSRNGEHKDGYQPPMEIRAKYTILAEGCRGNLTRKISEIFDLRANAQPQTYGIGIKELWEINPEKSQPGSIVHTIGWPLKSDTYGGSFIYHMNNNQLAIGYVVGLDYSNPYLDPYLEFQRFKHHPAVKPLLEGARRISYGARALNEGGFQSIPELAMPGGVVIGCAAGFLNVPKIKGTHTAMKSAMLAAEAIAPALTGQGGERLTAYPESVKQSWIYKELKEVRNVRPSFRFGLWAGLAYSALDTYLFRGNAPWTFGHHADHKQLKRASDCQPIAYPKPDGIISFDRMSSVYLSNTNHEEDQPIHLTLLSKEIPENINLPLYDGPEQRYCPAGVYEFVDNPVDGGRKLQINAQNCVHCKTCDIKDPTQNIVWVTPEGGGGPNYEMM